MSNRKPLFSLLLAVILLAGASTAILAFAGKGSPDKWDNLPNSGELTVTVTYPDGQPASGVNVIAGRKANRSDRDGVLKLTGIAAAPGVVSAEIVRPEGGFLGMFRNQVRYAAFKQVDPVAGSPLQAKLQLAPVSDLDSACRSCHPEKASSVNPIVRCVHKSGVPVKQAQVVRVRQFNRENEALHKAGKPAMPPIQLNEQAGKTGLFKSRQAVLGCMSCHTNHINTGVRKYVLMPFDDPSTLCRGCHV